MSSPYKLTEFSSRSVMSHRHLPFDREHEVTYFKVVVKTTEFQNRLNLPSSMVDWCGHHDRVVTLLVGLHRVSFRVWYKYKQIVDKKMNRVSTLTRLHMGWPDVAEYMDLHQGKTVELRTCVCDPRTFCMAKKLHPELIEVKPEEVEDVNFRYR
ncbi:hypothetical protein C2S52_007029 [Perilla frutescens var. hirtella]|nr:hypothetical protein C2S52_007029 [Perilla frutescens var. hirtella]